MWLNDTSDYALNNNEAIKKQNENLKSELADLVREIETNELVYGLTFTRPFSSIASVKNDAQLLENERKYFIEKLIQVHDVKKPYVQAEVMAEQVESCARKEYSPESLPLILNQFFLDRISWSVHAKHAHLLRWKRFSEHTSVIEDMYNQFKNRVSFIMSDYNDSIQRSQRLSAARDQFLGTGSCAQCLNVVSPDDIEIYLRWLISHFHSQKYFIQCMKVLEWLPYSMNIESIVSPVSITSTPSGQRSRQEIHKSFSYDRESSSHVNSKYFSNENDKYTTVTFNETYLNDTATPSMSNTYINKIYKRSDNTLLDMTNVTNEFPRNELLNSISFIFNQDELPMHNSSIEFLLPRLKYLTSIYKIDYNLARMQTSGDEMELFAAVNRKFRHVFTQQEHMKSFRVYDILEVSTENWGAHLPTHALKKESNWIDFIQIVPFKDAIRESQISKLKHRHSIVDEFLLPHNSFLEINDYERVQEVLKENSTLIKNQPEVKSIVSAKSNQFNTQQFWKKIFHNPNLMHKDETLKSELDGQPNNSANLMPKPISFRAKRNKKANEFNFTENLQKLGLDDSKTSEKELNNVQGSYLSFLLLRYLRTRDLKRKALSFLNYFRSIEKTLTIYDGGLSMEGKGYKRTSAQNHANETAYGGNLGHHAYMFNSPKDFRISELEFMEFNEIENHDDFYSTDEEGFVHVQDQRGYYVMYDSALSDLRKLEDELILVGSYYITKSKPNKQEAKKTLNLSEYSHQKVDRFAVLFDLWTNEVNFLEMKKNLIDLYYESYQNVFDKNEKRNLAQIMSDVMYRRVRFDLDANYFTQSYRLEINCVFKQIKITKIILNQMIDDMRNFLDKMNPNDVKYGLPYSLVKKNPICLTTNSNDSTLKNLYLMEFHPCLASASRLPEALRRSVEEFLYFMQPGTINERLFYEQNFYAKYIDRIEKLDSPGESFTPQLQKEVFNGVFVEDPQLMNDYVSSTLKQLEESSKNKTKKEQNETLINFLSQVLEMVTLRHRLIVSCMETEILSKLYSKLATDMGFEDFHMYMRYVQFDFAKYKENAGQAPPLFVSELGSNDLQVDRYVPANLYLAVNELDEGQIGKFSFRARENIAQFVRPGGIENLQLVLKLQITHNNALIVAIMQAHSCLLNSNLLPVGAAADNAESIKGKNDDRTDINQMSRLSLFTSTTNSKALSNKNIPSLKQYSDAFVSIQLEKNPYRDLMLNEFIKQKEAKSMILSNASEMEKLKRSLINTYVNGLNKKILQYSLRAQLIALYHSLMKILENFPHTRDNHFVFGEPFERRTQTVNKKTSNPTLNANMNNNNNNDDDDENDDSNNNNDNKKAMADDDRLNPDVKLFKKRPRKLLSDDGQRVLNMWFIPHYTDLLTIYKRTTNDDNLSVRALTHMVGIIAPLNDILNILYANAVMNVASSNALNVTTNGKSKKSIDFSSWENSGGLDSELNDLQLEMNQLNDPCDPEQVICLLQSKRKSMLLQYECAIRFAVRDIFLSSSRTDAYAIITENMHFSLRFLDDLMVNTNENTYLNVPEPLDGRDNLALEIIPWRATLSRNGPFLLKLWPWYLIEPNMSLCLLNLRDIEKNIAKGEILGISLQMEEILHLNNNNNNNNNNNSNTNNNTTGEHETNAPAESTVKSDRKLSTNVNQTTHEQTELTLHKKPNKLLNNYAEWNKFLMTWKRLEVLKLDWGRRKLGVEKINKPELFARFNENYKKEVLLPVLKALVKDTNFKDAYENFIDFTQPIVLPPQVSEHESKLKQIGRLLEKLEISMIDETIQRIQKDLKLVLAERGREESTLATDLWKKAIMKEEFTINKSSILDRFMQMFFSLAEQQQVEKEHNSNSSLNSAKKSSVYVIKEDDLTKSLKFLGSLVQEREKSNFEQYTMFYENMLRQQHQLLYNREREVRSIKSILDNKIAEINVEVQCQMADTCYDLILEVCALRSKLYEIKVEREEVEKELREKLKGEFIDLVNDLVNVNTNLRSELDNLNEKTYANVLEMLIQQKNYAKDKIDQFKKENTPNIDSLTESLLEDRRVCEEILIKSIQETNTKLKLTLEKQKTDFENKLNSLVTESQLKINDLTRTLDKVKIQDVDNRLFNELRNILISQQKLVLKKQLSKLDVECNNLKVKLDKELKEKEAKEHEFQQKMRNEKSLGMATKSNVEKLFQELEAKDVELRNIHLITEKAVKLSMINETRVQRELTNLRKNLSQERNLKLDAFQRVDQLQAHVYDLEDDVSNVNIPVRPHTTLSNYKNGRTSLASSPNLNMSTNKNNPFGLSFPKVNNESKSNSSYSNARPKTAARKSNRRSEDKSTESTDMIIDDFYEETTLLKLRQVRLKSAK